MDDNYLLEILRRNQDKSFVKRIIEPEKYPSLDLGGGRTASHLMSWGEIDGKYIAYPTVLYNGKSLNRYDAREAMKRVQKSGNYIEFKSPQEADWFSRNYKRYWEMRK